MVLTLPSVEGSQPYLSPSRSSYTDCLVIPPAYQCHFCLRTFTSAALCLEYISLWSSYGTSFFFLSGLCSLVTSERQTSGVLLSAEVAPSQYCTFGISRIFKLLPLNSQQSVLRSTRLRPVLTTSLLGIGHDFPLFCATTDWGVAPLPSFPSIWSSAPVNPKLVLLVSNIYFPTYFEVYSAPCCLIMLEAWLTDSFVCSLSGSFPIWKTGGKI